MRRSIPGLRKEGFRSVFVLKGQEEVDAAEKAMGKTGQAAASSRISETLVIVSAGAVVLKAAVAT